MSFRRPHVEYRHIFLQWSWSCLPRGLKNTQQCRHILLNCRLLWPRVVPYGKDRLETKPSYSWNSWVMATPPSVFVCLDDDLINMDTTVKFPTVSNSERCEDEGRISAVSVTGKEWELQAQVKSLSYEECLFYGACFVMGDDVMLVMFFSRLIWGKHMKSLGWIRLWGLAESNSQSLFWWDTHVLMDRAESGHSETEKRKDVTFKPGSFHSSGLAQSSISSTLSLVHVHSPSVGSGEQEDQKFSALVT